jgi:hypothetical protein
MTAGTALEEAHERFEYEYSGSLKTSIIYNMT